MPISPRDWEQDARADVLSTNVPGQPILWDFVISLQSKNALLIGTDSHLAKDKLRHQLKANMEKRLAVRCRNEKSNDVVDFQEWIAKVKHVDELLAADNLKFETIMKANRDANRRANVLAWSPLVA